MMLQKRTTLTKLLYNMTSEIWERYSQELSLKFTHQQLK